MEVASCVQEAGSHAASLLASLNLQREHAQFCDCVVRQRQNLGQLFPAHRCVLAASSPVFASVLSSTGALVELQAPCLSDSVLELVLDYIYTGALPYTHSQQQYNNLLTAADYLQMIELQEALRAELNAADNTNASTAAENQPYKDITNTYCKTENTFSENLPLSDTCSVNSLKREDQYSDDIDTCRTRNSSQNDANHCNRKDANYLSIVSTGCSVAESPGGRVNTGACRQVTYLAPQGLIQNIPCTTAVLKDQFHSAGTVKPDGWHMSTEEEQVRAAEKRRSFYLLHDTEVQEEEMGRVEKTKQLCLTVKSKAGEKQPNREEKDKIHQFPLLHLSTSHPKDHVSPSHCSPSISPSSPHLCSGAVTVIRHSSSAAMAEVSTVPHCQPMFQTSVVSSRAPDSPSGSIDNDRIVEGITIKHKNNHGAQNQDYRNDEDHVGAQSWDYKVSKKKKCAEQNLCYKSSADQSDTLKQDYNSSNTDHDEHMGNGLSHIEDDYDHDARYSFQNKIHMNHLRDDSALQNDDCSSFNRRLNCKTDPSFDDFPSKHQRPDCSDCHNVLMATAAEEQSIHLRDSRAVVSLPVEDTGSDSHCEDLCPQGEAKEEQSYSSSCPAETDREDSHSKLYRHKNHWYPNLLRAETSTKDSASIQHEHDENDEAMDNATGCTFQEHENISDTEISEPHLTFTIPIDNNMSDPVYSGMGQSYRGHLHYHCLSQEDTHLSHRDSDHKHSHLNHPDHSDQSNDDEEEEVGAFARRHVATTDQVLLLDISAKPAELLVSYRHRSEKDTFGNGLGVNDREQGHDATSAGVDKKKIRDGTKFGTESFDEAETIPWAGETNVEQRKCVGKEQSRPGTEVIHKAGFVEDENQIASLTVCSPQSVPDFTQAPVPPTLSLCSALSASLPTNTSAHLSSSVQHPFQCSLCDRSFSQRGSLNRHVRSHLGVRPFPCPRCPMTFSRQYRVIEHMRVHQRLGSDFQKPPASSV